MLHGFTITIKKDFQDIERTVYYQPAKWKSQKTAENRAKLAMNAVFSTLDTVKTDYSQVQINYIKQ